MSPEPRASAVIFDLDGTLVDSLEDIHDALVAALEATGHTSVTLDTTRSLIGFGSHHLIRGALPNGGPVELVRERFLDAYQRRLSNKTRPYPGVTKLLEALCADGIALGVATNKPAGLARELLTNLDLGAFFGAVSGGDETARKPDPSLLLLTLRRLGRDHLPRLGVHYVGDMPVDAEAAGRAGFGFIGAGWGFSGRHSGPPTWLQDPMDVRESLGR